MPTELTNALYAGVAGIYALMDEVQHLRRHVDAQQLAASGARLDLQGPSFTRDRLYAAVQSEIAKRAT